MRVLFLLSFLAFFFGCAHSDTRLSYKEVSSDFIGTWQQTKKCEVHETMKGDVVIKKSSVDPKSLEVAWVNREFSTFNGIGKISYIDVYKKSYEISTDLEVFDKGKTLVFGSIWKRTEGDTKNLAIIMKRYSLKAENKLVYEKFGYTAFEGDSSLEIKSYKEWFPKNYHCVMTRK